MEADVVGRGDDWGEVVTRYPYRKVGMDYLLKEITTIFNVVFKSRFLDKFYISYFSQQFPLGEIITLTYFFLTDQLILRNQRRLTPPFFV